VRVQVYSTCVQVAWTWSPSPRSSSFSLDKNGSQKWRQRWHLWNVFLFIWSGLVQVCSEASPRNWTFGNMWHLIVLLKLKVAIQAICILLLFSTPRLFNLLELEVQVPRAARSLMTRADLESGDSGGTCMLFFLFMWNGLVQVCSEASPRNWSWTFGNMWHLIMLLKLEVAIQEICTLLESSDCWCPQGPTNLWWDTAKVLVACLSSQIWFGFDLLKDFLELFHPFL